ncbi:MAG: response regulator [Betaproteobacteria bacterium]|nr:response regulator [Rhodocyclales bacterium]
MSKARKILIVDGNAFERKGFEQVLSGKGYAVTAASNGEDALWQLANGTYDAVFAELAMRGMSGLELAEQIHASQPGLPVAIITADGAEAAGKGAAAAGVVEFLKKPVSPEQLADAAARLLPATEASAALQAQTPEVENSPAQTLSKSVLRVKNVVLFFLAPFVGLAYLLAFPVFALGMGLWMALQQSEDAEPQQQAPGKRSMLRTIAMIPAAVLIGVAFAVIGPILGIGVLVWFGVQAWAKVGAKAMEA